MKKLCFLFILVACAFAPRIGLSADPAPQPAKAEILEYGRFELTGEKEKVANANTLDGNAQYATGARFVEKTNRVPATLGTQFGFRYKITGVTEEGTAPFKMVIVHPPIKNAKGEIERRYTVDESLPVKDGIVSEVSGYGLERPEELVPGVWTFEIWYKGKRMVTQTFTVYLQVDKKR